MPIFDIYSMLVMLKKNETRLRFQYRNNSNNTAFMGIELKYDDDQL